MKNLKALEYKVLTKTDLEFFENCLGKAAVLVSDLDAYASDATEELKFHPDVVLKPASTAQVSEIVSYCHRHLLPITPRGAGTGLAGGALPIKGGVVISMEKMNRILEIDERNFQVRVEPGVINYDLQMALSDRNLFYPPDPSSWQSSFIGGNIATNAGGPKAVKYGVTAQYVLNLEVVLPHGEVIWTGANTLKNSTGLNLTQLFVGSEGTLGIITQAVLKVIPKPKKDISILVQFRELKEACEAVSALFYANLHPSTLEFMEERAIDATIDFLSETWVKTELGMEAHLLISFDERIDKELKKCIEILTQFQIGEILFAESESEKQRIWQLRRQVAPIVKANGYTIEEDTVVPRANIGKLVEAMHRLADENGFKVVCYGHAGDGNIHVRIKHPKYKNSYSVPEVQEILTKVFEIVRDLGGTISGEHGIGLIQQNYLPIVFSKANLEVQQAIKKAIDPKNIMNPGKVFFKS